MKFITEYCPLIIFFILYKMYGIMVATTSMLFTTTLSLIISYYYEKKLPKATLISSVMIMISGGLTLFTGNADFIKMKPTLLYILFGSILFFGLKFNRFFLKSLLGANLHLPNTAWILLTKRFANYFIIMAILNEIVWRSFSENFWVNYKLFGTMLITFIFILSQARYVIQNSKNNNPIL